MQREEMTLLVVEDDQGYKFGALCFEEWASHKGFFGTGESFVFTFANSDQVQVFNGTGNNQMY